MNMLIRSMKSKAKANPVMRAKCLWLSVLLSIVLTVTADNVIVHTQGSMPDSIEGTTTPSMRSELVWELDLATDIEGSLVVEGNVIYAACYDSFLRAIEVDLPGRIKSHKPSDKSLPVTGKVLWEFDTQGRLTAAPAVSDGVVYVGSESMKLFAVDATRGTLLWYFNFGAIVAYSSPVVVGETVFMGCFDHFLYAIDTVTHTLRWKFEAGEQIASTPAVTEDTVFLGSDDQVFYAIDRATGDLRWSYETQGRLVATPAVAHGLVFFGSKDKIMYALNEQTGERVWEVVTDNKIYSAAVVFGDMVIFGSQDHYLYNCRATDGRVNWRFRLPTPVESAPVISDSVLYVVAETVFALNPETGAQLWTYEAEVSTAPAVHDGFVYVESYGGKVEILRGKSLDDCPHDNGWSITEAGKMVYLDCDAGYEGIQTRGCGLDGVWEEATSTCKRLYCEAADWPTIASGESAFLSCDAGYSGNRTRHCDLDGEYADIIDRCEEIYCEARDGFPTVRAGETAIVGCAHGMEGSKSRFCAMDGVFGDIQDECVIIPIPGFFEQLVDQPDYVWIAVFVPLGVFLIACIAGLRIRKTRKRDALLKESGSISNTILALETTMSRFNASVASLRRDATELNDTLSYFSDAVTPRTSHSTLTSYTPATPRFYPPPVDLSPRTRIMKEVEHRKDVPYAPNLGSPHSLVTPTKSGGASFRLSPAIFDSTIKESPIEPNKSESKTPTVFAKDPKDVHQANHHMVDRIRVQETPDFKLSSTPVTTNSQTTKQNGAAVVAPPASKNAPAQAKKSWFGFGKGKTNSPDKSFTLDDNASKPVPLAQSEPVKEPRREKPAFVPALALQPSGRPNPSMNLRLAFPQSSDGDASLNGPASPRAPPQYPVSPRTKVAAKTKSPSSPKPASGPNPTPSSPRPVEGTSKQK